MSIKQLFTIFSLMLIAVSISAEVPNTINYQGRLTDAAGNPVADAAYSVKFIIYDAPTAGTDLWNTGFQTINTVDGMFSYQLGSMVVLPSNIFADTSRYLGLTVGADTELSPRTRFISTPYTYQAKNATYALNADIAQNSKNLNSEESSYYLEWNNMTNIPAGFADGTDDEGLSQATADADYVNVTGDDITGNLNAKDGSNVTRVELSGVDAGLKTFALNGALTSKLSSTSFGFGELNLYGTSEYVEVALLSDGVGGSLHLFDPAGPNGIFLNAGFGGNSSVSLPDNAIDNTEILDEPGISQGSTTSSTTLTISQTTMEDIVTTSITIPASGYIFLIAKCYVRHSGTTSENYAYIQVDEEAGGSFEAPHYNTVGNTGYSLTLEHRFSTTITRTYYKSSAGTYTFRLEAMKALSAGTSIVYQPIITALYIPTSYGTVSAVAPDPNGDPDAKLISITDEDGNTHTGYEIDLRNLELEVKAAQLKAKEAELKLLKAQQQQRNNNQN